MTLKKSSRFLLSIAVFCAAANAAEVFNFDNDNLGTSTTFTDTVNGLSATFASAVDPGGFVIYGADGMFETLTGNVLGDPGPAPGSNGINLSITFNQNLSAVLLDFSTADFGSPSPLTITAYENSTEVGWATSTGMVLPGFTFPEGEIALSGETFNNIVVSSAAPDFAVDNLDVATATAPEPAVSGLFGLGLLALGVPAVYRKAKRAAVAQ